MVIKNKFGRIVDVPDSHARFIWNDPDVIEVISISDEMLYSDDEATQKLVKDIKAKYPTVGVDSDQMLDEVTSKPEEVAAEDSEDSAPESEAPVKKGVADETWTIEELLEYLVECGVTPDSKTKKLGKAKLVVVVNKAHEEWYKKQQKGNE